MIVVVLNLDTLFQGEYTTDYTDCVPLGSRCNDHLEVKIQ